MILLSGLIFRSSVIIFGKQIMVYQSAVTVFCSLRGIVVLTQMSRSSFSKHFENG
ncbi:unnamed protein product [Acanthoscelides obtectus]|uniref:Uncharacterized protein n=1 Tax=Acanthoscelides obtectus TaxID=200917 RepID=A0A9P0LXQ7_ACAOB|nr:unnamed protein product [Acanthoscelides obtectus]CAK1635807.1 hypothetical protein AOBTE_LOCUS9523 [Acanthoscelides obtectus]